MILERSLLYYLLQFQFIASEALMSHYSENYYTNSLHSHIWKSRYHGILQAIAGFMVIWGTLVKYVNTTLHFQTWHGLIGKIANFKSFKLK